MTAGASAAGRRVGYVALPSVGRRSWLVQAVFVPVGAALWQCAALRRSAPLTATYPAVAPAPPLSPAAAAPFGYGICAGRISAGAAAWRGKSDGRYPPSLAVPAPWRIPPADAGAGSAVPASAGRSAAARYAPPCGAWRFSPAFLAAPRRRGS